MYTTFYRRLIHLCIVILWALTLNETGTALLNQPMGIPLKVWGVLT